MATAAAVVHSAFSAATALQVTTLAVGIQPGIGTQCGIDTHTQPGIDTQSSMPAKAMQGM
jgi:hypothetical protein